MRFFVLAFFCFIVSGLRSQTADSIKRLIHSESSDSVKVAKFYQYGMQSASKPSIALEIMTDMISFADSLKNKKLLASLYRKIGVFYFRLEFQDKAIEFTLKSAELSRELNDKPGLINAYNNLGNFYNAKGEITKGRDFFLRAVDYHLRSLALRKEINDSATYHFSYINIASSYLCLKEYEKALEYYNLTYRKYASLHDTDGLNILNVNLGETYLEMAERDNDAVKYKIARGFFEKLYHYYSTDSLNDRYVKSLVRLGQIALAGGQPEKALSYLHTAYRLEKLKGNKTLMLETVKQIIAAHEKGGDPKTALFYTHEYIALKDSLVNEQNSANIEHMNALYRASETEKEIQKLNNDKKMGQAELQSQKRQRNFFIIGFSILIILSFVIFGAYRQKQRANLIIAQQKKEVEEQKQLVDHKNKEILDSIRYAKRIQLSLITSENYITKAMARLINKF